MHESTAELLARHAHPRYWGWWLGLSLLYGITLLPLSVQRLIGRGLGRLALHGLRTRRRVAEANLAHCFPELDRPARRQLLKTCFEDNAIGYFEAACAWFRDPENLHLEVQYEGVEYLIAAQTTVEGHPRGIILLGGHFSTLDMGGLLYTELARQMSAVRPAGGMQRDHDNPLFNAVMTRGRERFVTPLVGKDDLRGFLRLLKQGGTIWYAIDQDYGMQSSVFAPFFGLPAATLTTLSRMVARSGAAIVPFSHFRRPDGSYVVRFEPAIEPFPGENDVADAGRCNAAIEQAVRRYPSQYLWMHRRFKTQPDGDHHRLYRSRLLPDDRVLVISLRRLGDLLLTTPLIHSLRLRLPRGKISVLVHAGQRGILEGNPDIDQVIEMPARPTWQDWRQFHHDHGKQFDWAISTQAGDRPTLYAILAGRRSLGFVPTEAGKAWWKRALLSRSVPFDASPLHTVLRCRQLCDALGIPARLKLIPPGGFEHKDSESGLPAAAPYVVCHPLPMYAYKRWPNDRWQALIRDLHARGFTVYISGGPAEAERAELDQLLAPVASFVVRVDGTLSFRQLADLIARARHFFGTDTSVTHLAAATGTPVTAIFGPSDPRLWGPWPVNHTDPDMAPPWQARGPLQHCGNVTIIQDQAACVPCQQEGCDRHRNSRAACLEQIPVAVVLSTLEAHE